MNGVFVEAVLMDALLPLDQMTAEEKLRALEAIWDDLCRNDEQIPVADWQKELLDHRQGQIAAGEAKFSDWETVRQSIRERTASAEMTKPE